MITRFSILPDERRIILGRDLASVFEEGIVYEAHKVLDEIVLKPVGRYALPKEGVYPCELSEVNAIVYSGLHLITDKENDYLAKNND